MPALVPLPAGQPELLRWQQRCRNNRLSWLLGMVPGAEGGGYAGSAVVLLPLTTATELCLCVCGKPAFFLFFLFLFQVRISPLLFSVSGFGVSRSLCAKNTLHFFIHLLLTASDCTTRTPPRTISYATPPQPCPQRQRRRPPGLSADRRRISHLAR